MKLFQRVLSVIMLLGLLGLSNSSIVLGAAQDSSPSSWQQTVYGTNPGPGCWQVEYPSTTWTSVPCGQPTPSTSEEQIGGGYDDEYADSTLYYVQSATGSFSMESNFGSESDTSSGSNAYSLQLNTNLFTCSYNGHTLTNDCIQQFVYNNAPGGSVYVVYIEYWLLGYYSTYGSCPPPGLVSWSQAGSSNCTAFSSSTSVGSSQSPSSLDSYHLMGSTVVSGSTWDYVQFCNSSYCYSVTVDGTVLNLASGWVDSQFNVLGQSNGSGAIFTPTSGNTFSIYDDLTVSSPYGNTTPTCNAAVPNSVEYNNMYLGSGSYACSAGTSNIVYYEYT